MANVYSHHYYMIVNISILIHLSCSYFNKYDLVPPYKFFSFLLLIHIWRGWGANPGEISIIRQMDIPNAMKHYEILCKKMFRGRDLG